MFFKQHPHSIITPSGSAQQSVVIRDLSVNALYSNNLVSEELEERIHFTHLCLSTKYLRKVDKYLHNPYIRTLFISHLYFSPFILFVMFYSLFLKISSGFGIKNVTNKSFCHSNHILSENVGS